MVTAGLAESNGSLPPFMIHVSCRLTGKQEPGSAPNPTLSNWMQRRFCVMVRCLSVCPSMARSRKPALLQQRRAYAGSATLSAYVVADDRLVCVCSSDWLWLRVMSSHVDEVSSHRRHAVLHWHGAISPWTQRMWLSSFVQPSTVCNILPSVLWCCWLGGR